MMSQVTTRGVMTSQNCRSKKTSSLGRIVAKYAQVVSDQR